MVMVYMPANEDEDEDDLSCMAFGASGHMDCNKTILAEHDWLGCSNRERFRHKKRVIGNT